MKLPIGSIRSFVPIGIGPLSVLGLLVVTAGIAIGTDPLLGSLLMVGLLGGVAMIWQPMIGIFALIGSLVIGQLVRIPVAEGAVLPNDLLLPLVAFGWLLRGLWRGQVVFSSSPLSWPIALMIVVFVLTFLAGSAQLPFLTSGEMQSSALYIVRWIEYALLLFIVADVVRSERHGRRVLLALLGAAGLLAILGFIQLRLFPDFRFMVPAGWDPHIGRLLSTWFDPNFLGGFLGFMLVVAGGLGLFLRGRLRIYLWVLVGLLFAAIVLTFSRSSYAAFLAGVGVLTWLRSRWLFLIFIIVAPLVVLNVPRVQERIQGALTLDVTTRLRLQSWENALTVYRDYPWTGVGYNTYRYVQVNYGFQEDAAEHSAGGSDSSLLTILVTTGPIGLLVYLIMLGAYFIVAWRSWRRGVLPWQRGLGLGAFAGMASVVVHSFFINSLLFPHMMETMAITFGTLVGLQVQERNGPVRSGPTSAYT